ncbi:MAG: lysozyme [Betaproteobacteria bacterium]|nr:lysozyme [Betaproteobacteria bacterium]
MRASDVGLSFIMKWEGTVLKPYKDIAGIWTIGCGHVIKPGEQFGEITLQQAMDLLRSDIKVAEGGVNKAVNVPLTQPMFDALCSFAFNVGTGALSASSALKKLNAGDYAAAADLLLLWSKVRDPKTGALVTSAGLYNRRLSEKQLFLSQGVTPADAVPEPVLSEADRAQVELWISSSVAQAVDDAISASRDREAVSSEEGVA